MQVAVLPFYAHNVCQILDTTIDHRNYYLGTVSSSVIKGTLQKRPGHDSLCRRQRIVLICNMYYCVPCAWNTG